jgi:hypothetical protein
MLSMLSDAKIHYERDALWEKLLLGKPGLGKSGLTKDEFNHLWQLCYKKSLERF